MKRRDFLKHITVGGLLVANGSVVRQIINLSNSDVAFRFLVASDGHYGQPETNYENYFTTVVTKINRFNQLFPSQFVVYNGDIIHDEPRFLDPAWKSLSKTTIPSFVTKGNHDMVSAKMWQEKWGYPQNHVVSFGERVILLGTTSNEKGDYLCPDVKWFRDTLEANKAKSEVYIFLHITPDDWTANGIECPEFHDLLAKYDNITAVFNGHDHDQDDIKMKGGIPFMFSGHFGGSWGTDYRGFRVVEKMKNGTLRTFLMDPDQKIKEEVLSLVTNESHQK